MTAAFNDRDLFRIAQKHRTIADFGHVKGSEIKVPTFDRYDHLAASLVIAEGIEAYNDLSRRFLEEVAQLRGELGLAKLARRAAVEEADAAKRLLAQLRVAADEKSPEEVPNATPA